MATADKSTCERCGGGGQLGGCSYCGREDNAFGTQVGGDHYREQSIQPIQFIVSNDLDWFQGNIVKYTVRHKYKGGASDLKKAIHYLQLALEMQYPDEV